VRKYYIDLTRVAMPTLFLLWFPNHLPYYIDMEDIQKQLQDEVKKLTDPQNIRVIECAVLKGKNGLNISVIIDKDGGVTIDDCERVSRMFTSRIDILELLEDENYNLKVSSPGIDREFKSDLEYDLFRSRDVKIFLKKSLDQMDAPTVVRGQLLGMKNGLVKIKRGDEIVAIPLEEIKKTKLDG
jgi:ribosome maturation factor RimP